jgi:hypothetical protein
MKERPVMVGLVSTRMRYIELRNPDLKGSDRPEFTPTSLLFAPEVIGGVKKQPSNDSSISAKNGRHTHTSDE